MKWELTDVERDGSSSEEQVRRDKTIKWMKETRDGAEHWVVLSWNPILETNDYDASSGASFYRLILRMASNLLVTLPDKQPPGIMAPDKGLYLKELGRRLYTESLLLSQEVEPDYSPRCARESIELLAYLRAISPADVVTPTNEQTTEEPL
jgi:hypothetical protein